MNFWKRQTFGLLALSLVLFLSGCSPLFAFTPEQVATEQALNFGSMGGSVDPNSVRVTQTLPLADRVIVQVAFRATDEQGRLNECLFVYETIKSALGWRTGSGGGSCSGVNNQPEPNPIGVGTGHSGGVDFEYTHVDGEVYQPDIVVVEVEWEDGTTQKVEVINSTYLVARVGDHNPVEIRGLSDDNVVLFTFQPPNDRMPPGKMELEKTGRQ